MAAKSERKKQIKAEKQTAAIVPIGEVVANAPITKAQIEEAVMGIIQRTGHAANAVGFMRPTENSEGPYPAGRYLVFKVDPAGQLVFVDLTNRLKETAQPFVFKVAPAGQLVFVTNRLKETAQPSAAA